jgi:hypothetical protein
VRLPNTAIFLVACFGLAACEQGGGSDIETMPAESPLALEDEDAGTDTGVGEGADSGGEVE